MTRSMTRCFNDLHLSLHLSFIILFNLIANNSTITNDIQIRSVELMVIFMGIGIHVILY